jgi:hypothetical protein
MRAAGIDFGRQADEEVVILSRKTRQRVSDGLVTARTLLHYDDTAETIALRNTVRDLNAFLEEAAIAFVDDGNGPMDPAQPHDDRTPRFDPNGRFLGVFWQNLSKDQRQGIRVEGEEAEPKPFEILRFCGFNGPSEAPSVPTDHTSGR